MRSDPIQRSARPRPGGRKGPAGGRRLFGFSRAGGGRAAGRWARSVRGAGKAGVAHAEAGARGRTHRGGDAGTAAGGDFVVLTAERARLDARGNETPCGVCPRKVVPVGIVRFVELRQDPIQRETVRRMVWLPERGAVPRQGVRSAELGQDPIQRETVRRMVWSPERGSVPRQGVRSAELGQDPIQRETVRRMVWLPERGSVPRQGVRSAELGQDPIQRETVRRQQFSFWPIWLPRRHGRTCSGHPSRHRAAGMAGTSPAMTLKGRTARPKRELLVRRMVWSPERGSVPRQRVRSAELGQDPIQRETVRRVVWLPERGRFRGRGCDPRSSDRTPYNGRRSGRAGWTPGWGRFRGRGCDPRSSDRTPYNGRRCGGWCGCRSGVDTWARARPADLGRYPILSLPPGACPGGETVRRMGWLRGGIGSWAGGTGRGARTRLPTDPATGLLARRRGGDASDRVDGVHPFRPSTSPPNLDPLCGKALKGRWRPAGRSATSHRSLMPASWRHV
jgi:hypothetical protein